MQFTAERHDDSQLTSQFSSIQTLDRVGPTTGMIKELSFTLGAGPVQRSCNMESLALLSVVSPFLV